MRCCGETVGKVSATSGPESSGDNACGFFCSTAAAWAAYESECVNPASVGRLVVFGMIFEVCVAGSVECGGAGCTSGL